MMQRLVTRIRLPQSPKRVRWVATSCDQSTAQTVVQHAANSKGQQRSVDPEPNAERRCQDEQLEERQHARRALQTIEEQLVELEHRRQQSVDELQTAAVELAIMATASILQRAVDREEFPIQQLVADAIQRLESSRQIVITLHPDDLKSIQQVTPTAEAADNENKTANVALWDRVQFQSDPSMKRGSCWADGGDFGLLSTLERRIEDVRQCFMEGLDDAQVERRAIATKDQSMRRFPDRRETA